MALLFNETYWRTQSLIADLQYIFQRTVEPIRPGRKYSRNHKVKPRKILPAIQADRFKLMTLVFKIH